MGDMADWAYDQAEEDVMLWHDHKLQRCGGEEYCRFCLENRWKVESYFNQTATGGSHKQEEI